MVDIPNQCKVCGANLAAVDGTETCGDACARVARYGESPEVARIRAKIAARMHPCGDGNCPGWAVFNADTDPVLDPCIECWSGEAEPLYVEDVEALPEAQQELSLAINDGDAYDHPDVGAPCKCGCVVRRHTPGGAIVCSACGNTVALAVVDTLPADASVIATLGTVDAMEFGNALRCYARELQKNATTYDRHLAATLAEDARDRAKRFVAIADAIDCDPIRIIRTPKDTATT